MQSHILNWDHEINPTPQEDLFENVKTLIGANSAWPLFRVSIAKGQALHVEVAVAVDGKPIITSSLLVIDLKNDQIYHGNPSAYGIGPKELNELRMWYRSQALCYS